MVIYEYHYNGGNLQIWTPTPRENDVCFAKFVGEPCEDQYRDKDEPYQTTEIGVIGYVDGGYGWYRVVEIL